MRTTLTLEDDVARLLQERARRSGESFKQVVNETLRAGMQRGRKPAPVPPRFQVKPTACGFRGGVDVLRLNQLNDEIESDEALRKLAVAATKPAKR